MKKILIPALLPLTVALLAACGGPADSPLASTASAAKGGTTPVPGPSPLPSAPPSPDMVIRESFGLGPSFARPAGGKGTWNPIALRVDPVAQAVTVRVNGVAYGPFAAPVGAPRYAGFEGQGVLDDFVVRGVL